MGLWRLIKRIFGSDRPRFLIVVASDRTAEEIRVRPHDSVGGTLERVGDKKKVYVLDEKASPVFTADEIPFVHTPEEAFGPLPDDNRRSANSKSYGVVLQGEGYSMSPTDLRKGEDSEEDVTERYAEPFGKRVQEYVLGEEGASAEVDAAAIFMNKWAMWAGIAVVAVMLYWGITTIGFPSGNPLDLVGGLIENAQVGGAPADAPIPTPTVEVQP